MPNNNDVSLGADVPDGHYIRLKGRSVAKKRSQKQAEAAWERLMALGASGVWEPDMVVVSLSDTAITDADLQVFRDFPYVEILDLSRTHITAAGLQHLAGLHKLQSLNLEGVKLSEAEIRAFRKAHPNVEVTTKRIRKGSVNPFTGEPM